MPKEPSQQPDPNVAMNPMLEKRGRRVFTAEYPLNTMQQVDDYELGQVLHSEQLCSESAA